MSPVSPATTSTQSRPRPSMTIPLLHSSATPNPCLIHVFDTTALIPGSFTMSGLLYEAETPCPQRSNTSRIDRSSDGSNTFDSPWDDNFDSFEDTGDIDFTTEIRAPVLTGAKPRRGNRSTTSFHIHDDNEGRAAPATRRKREKAAAAPSTRKSSLLSQPAQRFRPKVNFAPSPPAMQQRQSLEPRNNAGRDSNVERNKTLLEHINGKGQGSEEKGALKNALKKDVRRNTVYIPSDDTTVATVFMGLFSPLKSQTSGGTKDCVPDDTQINTVESRIAAKRQRRAHARSPKSAPLQPSARIAQEASIRVDIAGKNGGKENIPPGTILDSKDKEPARDLPLFELTQKPKRTPGNVLDSSKLSRTEPKAIRASVNSRGRAPAARRANGSSQKRPALGDKQHNARPPTFDSGINAVNISKQMPGKPALASRNSTSSNVAKQSRPMPSSKAAPSSNLKNLNTEYQLLTENISNPAMYEDDWLLHQEIVVTQLVNGLFDYTGGKSSSVDPESLRYELLKLYQNDSFIRLHKRLQASVGYGPMSAPNFVLARSNSLRQDLGLKRKFINIWTKTYDLHALRAAVETVVGRRISIDQTSSQRSFGSSPYGLDADDKMLRRKLEHFIEVFLLRNEDMDHHVGGNKEKRAEAGCRAYRRTILRSIMVVALLDKGRLSPGMVLPRQLFASSSTFKSSAAVAQALGRLLLPSSGDITKPLGHLDCRLSYKQHDLQEYKYEISNIAVDLRDGVRLTRIVELLLYRSNSYSIGDSDPDCSTTLTLPGGKLLPLGGEDGNCPLSQHLRFPCVSRAVKLFNVRIALGALNSTMGTRALVNDTRAEDIVDGHRERTIALLWGLVSKWGLGGLVDWDDVRREIDRLKRKAMFQFGDQVSDQNWFNGDLGESPDEHSSLLKQWAGLLAGMKGIYVENLSTNFADGKVYESIVDEYEEYLLGAKEHASPVGKPSGQENLGLRLQVLGCCPQFGRYHSIALRRTLTTSSPPRLPRSIWKHPRPRQRLHACIPRLPLLPTPVRLETSPRSSNIAAHMATDPNTPKPAPTHYSQRHCPAVCSGRASQRPDHLGAGRHCAVVEGDNGETAAGMKAGDRRVERGWETFALGRHRYWEDIGRLEWCSWAMELCVLSVVLIDIPYWLFLDSIAKQQLPSILTNSTAADLPA